MVLITITAVFSTFVLSPKRVCLFYRIFLRENQLGFLDDEIHVLAIFRCQLGVAPLTDQERINPILEVLDAN